MRTVNKGLARYAAGMPRILIASDASWVVDDVEAALGAPNTTIVSVNRGAKVRSAVAAEAPDLVILDLQIGNMGGMAVAIDLHLEAGAERIPSVPVLMLLDRRADVFLAKRSYAKGWVIKPLDSLRLRRAADALLAGDSFHDTTGTQLVVKESPPLPIG